MLSSSDLRKDSEITKGETCYVGKAGDHSALEECICEYATDHNIKSATANRPQNTILSYNKCEVNCILVIIETLTVLSCHVAAIEC